MAIVRIGTCSWKYPSWKGLVYSRASGINYLYEYSRRYTTVEIDQWFWTLPERATAAEYAAATPKNFLFTVKLPNAITLTHFYRKKGEAALRPNPQFLSPALFEDVLFRLEPLHGKIGMLMLQFEYLNKQKMASQSDFLDRLGNFFDVIPRALPCGIETRNPKWLDESWFAFLTERRLGSVFLQGYYMPPITSLYEQCASALRGTVVVRLHGPDREGVEKAAGENWDRIVAPKDGELPGIVEMIHNMRDRGLTVFLNVNNHYEGSAPLSIERLREKGLIE